MLCELLIEDFAIIDHLELSFDDGLNVLTGETGTGKSIVVDAVQLLLGGRASSDMIRAGCQRARVTGLFDLARAPWCREQLAQLGFDDDGDQVVLSREIAASGRSTARINGRPAAVGQLRTAAAPLVDLHGQHDFQSLLNPATHRPLLDTCIGGELPAVRQEVAASFERYRDLRRQLTDLTGDERARIRAIDLHRFQSGEIEAAALQPEEEEQLRGRRRRLVNATRLREALAAAYDALHGVDSRIGVDIPTALGEAIGHLEGVLPFDGELAPLVQTLYTLQEDIGALARELRQRGDQTDLDPAALAAVEERLMLINNLKKKYGDSIPAILAFRDEAVAELSRLEAAAQAAAHLETALAEQGRRLSLLCERLSVLRRRGAVGLREQLEGVLAELGMAGAIFQVNFSLRDDPEGVMIGDRLAAVDAGGVEQVEFFLSTNPGEPPRPLQQIASGGELSRFMLAFKSLLTGGQQVPTVIFDEIDAGVGGRTALAVAAKLAAIARRHQVICVTHLPIIAAAAQRHFTVTKGELEGRTVTRIEQLGEQEREFELARMLGGDAQTVDLAHARALLARARGQA